ncbi:MAG: hypothetical protein J6S77_02940 [Clostridia bacterium]|nr:hypothetical protein [Clostridia bacterium]
MNAVFETVLEMSVKACFVVAVVMIARLILARAPKKHSYILWIAVALRLCLPFSVGTKLSIFGIGQIFGEANVQTVITDPLPNEFLSPDIIPEAGNQNVITDIPVAPVISPNTGVSVMQILTVFWLCGVAAMLIYGAVSYIIVYRRMSTATRYEGNVFCSENVLSPFTLGFIKPKIYIPYGLDDITREKVIAHERCHINRFDHFIKPFAFILLAVHWFNPLCWLAFNRMSLDMEMSCDEKLLRTQGDEEMKKAYTKALLSFASNRRFPAPGPVNFNESGNAKKRINNSLNYKKPRVWVSVLAYLICAVMLVACATDASGTTYTDINKTVFADAPYVVTYKSNGDGTCTVTDIIVDYSAETQVTVVIPEFSPDGDKVTKVEMKDFNTLASLNVPVLITNESFNKIKDTLKEIETEERDIDRFISFYDPHEQDGIYVLEPLINEAEYNRISDILKNAGYTSQNAYDAAVEVVNTVPASSDDAVALRLQAFDYFYHSANKIKCVIVPEGTEVIGIDSLLVIYHTVDADYISGYISGETSFVPKTENNTSQR